MAFIRLRFVRNRTRFSLFTGFDERFWATHVEAVMPDGKYIGAYHEGVGIRDPGYDDSTWSHQLFLDLPCTEAQQRAHEAYLRKRIGTPYDWMSIVGFVAHMDFHSTHHLICSALAHMSLRQPEAPYFPYPLAIPAHQTSPAILAIVLSGIVRVGDPEVRAS